MKLYKLLPLIALMTCCTALLGGCQKTPDAANKVSPLG